MARILIVNDENDLLELTTLVLVERGHEVLAACSREEAVRRAEERHPDALVLDLVVRGSSGEQVWDAICQRIGRVPLIVLSASPDGACRARAMAAEAYVCKPFTEEILLDAVEKVLANQQPATVKRS